MRALNLTSFVPRRGEPQSLAPGRAGWWKVLEMNRESPLRIPLVPARRLDPRGHPGQEVFSTNWALMSRLAFFLFLFFPRVLARVAVGLEGGGGRGLLR